MVDLKSIKINNLTDHHFLGGGTNAPPPAPYLVWENILEFGYSCQAPRTDPPGGLDDVSQISKPVNTDHSSTHQPLHFLTLQAHTDPTLQTTQTNQPLKNNSIVFCPFTLWTSGPAGPPRRRPPPLCACGALSCGKQYKPTGLRVVAPQAHTESGPTEAL